ncbi:MAG TPA: aminodeoxychorismate/anthranilate synthase component II [Candidatus Saccharimonadales bacterium]|nr:aminodeoxychorismate/anthranilate synthase component II [Candidatus Saccharimonadales bacterium]
MILVIDNYDSFTYNLVQYLGELGAEVRVVRNDAVTAGEVESFRPAGIVISPGPKRPEDAGVSNDVLRRLSGQVPILGVCLGHECIGHVFGGRVVRAARLMHGKTSLVIHDGTGIFERLENPFNATRYHSLIVDRASLPADLRVCAWTAEGEVMGLQLAGQPTWGVQFHPESILTGQGRLLLRNFLNLAGPSPSR